MGFSKHNIKENDDESEDYQSPVYYQSTLDSEKYSGLRILVPVDVQALVIDENPASTTIRKDLTDGLGMKSSTNHHNHFDKNTSGLEKGIHLHWSLPDALLMGEIKPTSATDEHEFSPLPDRWIVVRQWPKSSQNGWNSKAWIIESTSRQVTPLEEWQSPGAVKTKITAIDDGDPDTEEDLAWLESYDGAKDIFTFHDSPEQNVIGPLNYLVAGWYSEKQADPLYASTSTTQSTWFEHLEKLGWTIDHKSILNQIAKSQSTTNSQIITSKGGSKNE
tara:strand:+ start:82 stop:909 length:828 start_codon:yes stop_codon:yes gene_type:complete